MLNCKNTLTVKTNNSFNAQKRNIYFVSTAFQLMGAIEAQKYFKTKNNILVFLYFGNQNNDESQIKEILNLFPYDKLIIFSKREKGFIQLTIALIKEFEEFEYQNVFVGFYSANIRRIIANIKYKHLYLLDDGIYTISIHNELYGTFNSEFIQYILPFSEKRRKTRRGKIKFFLYHQFRKLYFLIHGYKSDMDSHNLNFFTMFSLPQYNNELIITHQFNRIKDVFNISEKCMQNSNYIYFLGQPLYGRVANIDKDMYLNYLEKIFNQLSQENKKIIYIPHRAEDILLIDTISNKYDVEIITTPINIEFYFLTQGIYPQNIVSFSSTALISIKIIFPLSYVDSYLLPSCKETKQTLELIYKQIENENIHLNSLLIT